MDGSRKKICLVSHYLNLVLMLLVSCQAYGSEINEVDPKGYVMYCPCMGRFGNQADQFLGALSFAHGLDRTLILPPWVEYPPALRKNSIQIPFDKYFKVDPLREYHRVITMETFMDKLAPSVWPAGKRTGICSRYRGGKDCKMKEGNPPGPFWNKFNINFDAYQEYLPLTHDTHVPQMRKDWEERFPLSEYPVIALSGAPGAFPVAKENRELHRYLHWSDEIEKQADQFIEENLSSGPFVGVHMRQGSDWLNACKLVGKGDHFFASPQCLGYENEHGVLSQDLCEPSFDLVKEQIKAIVKKTKAKWVFIASDVEPNIKGLKKALPTKVKIIQRKPSEPHVDLAILARSDHFIGNCLSSFSSFAKRERDISSKPTSFWGFGEDYEKFKRKGKKRESPDEL